MYLQYGLVEVLQLRHREDIRKELESDRLKMNLLLEAAHGHTQDAVMIEGQGRGLAYREPPRLGGIVTSLDFLYLHKGIMGNRYHSAPRIAAGFAEGMELLNEGILQSGFLFQFPSCSGKRIFIHIEKAAGEGPAALERFYSPLYEKNLQFLPVVSEYHAIRSHRRTGIIVSICTFNCHYA